MKIVIIEDHSLIADLLAAVCRRDLRYEVVAVETSGIAGLAAVRQIKPDMVLLDLSLPDADGVEIADVVRRELPAARVLILTSLRDPATLRRVRDIGVHGFIDKREPKAAVLRDAIRDVAGGQIYFSPIFAQVIGQLNRNPNAFHRVLSPYEQRVLQLIGEGLTDEEVGSRLDIRPMTAQSRRRDIMNKLGIHSTPKLMRFAIENGFTRPEHFPPPPEA